MNGWFFVWWAVVAAITLAVLLALIKGGQPVRRALSSAVQGFVALLAVNVVGAVTGVSLAINSLTAGSCLLLGTPGVVLLLLLKTVFR